MRRFIFVFFALGLNTRGAVGAQPAEAPHKRLEIEKSYPSKAEYEKEKHRGRRWIAADKQSIRFYGADGRMERELKGDYSREGGTEEVVHHQLLKKRDKIFIEHIQYLPGEAFTARWEIVGADGASVALDWKDAGQVWPSPDGAYFVGIGLVGYHSDGKLRFFGSDGRLRKEVEPFDSGSERNRVVFSDDGNYGVLQQSGRRYNPSAGSPIPGGDVGRVAIFDQSGNIVAKKEKPGWDVVGPGSEDDGPHVRVLSKTRRVVFVQGDISSTVDCLDFNGSLLWSYPSRSSQAEDCGLESMVVSTDESRLALFASCKDKSAIKVLATDSGSLISEVEIDIGTGETSRPWKPIPRSQWHRFNFKRMGDGFALAYARAQRSKETGGRRGHGLILFDAQGRKVDETVFTAPIGDVENEDEESLVLKQGKRVVKWRIGKESK